MRGGDDVKGVEGEIIIYANYDINLLENMKNLV